MKKFDDRFASTNSMNALPSGFNEMGWTPKVNKPGSSSAAHKSLSKPWIPKTSTSRTAAVPDVGWAPKPRPASAFFVPQQTSAGTEQGWTDNTQQAIPASPSTYAVPAWTASSELQPPAGVSGGRSPTRQQLWQPNGGGVEEPPVPAWYGSLRSAGTRRPWQGGKDGPRGPQKLRGEEDEGGWIPHGVGRAQEPDFGGHESRWIQEQTARINAQGLNSSAPIHQYQQSLPVVQEAADRREWESDAQYRNKQESESRRFKSELHDIHLVSTTWTLPVQDASQARQSKQATVYAGPIPAAQNQQQQWQGPVPAAQAIRPVAQQPVHRSQLQAQQQQQQQLPQHQQQLPQHHQQRQQQQIQHQQYQPQPQQQQRTSDQFATAAAVKLNPPSAVGFQYANQAPPKSVEQRVPTATVNPGQLQSIPGSDRNITQNIGQQTNVNHILAAGVQKPSAFEDFYVKSASTVAAQPQDSAVASKIVDEKPSSEPKLPAFNDFYVISAASDVKVQASSTSTKAVSDVSAEAKAMVPEKTTTGKVVSVPAFSDFYVQAAGNDVKTSSPSTSTQSASNASIQAKAVIPEASAVEKVVGSTVSAEAKVAVPTPDKSSPIKEQKVPAFVDFYVLPASSEVSTPLSNTTAAPSKTAENKAGKFSAFEDFYVKVASAGEKFSTVSTDAGAAEKPKAEAKVEALQAAKIEAKIETPKADSKVESMKEQVKAVVAPKSDAKVTTSTEPASAAPKTNAPPSVVKKPAPAVAPPAPKGKLTMPSAFGNKAPPGKLKPK